MTNATEVFSEIGDRYGEQLARGLALTGENAEYFARGRMARVAQIARERGVTVRAMLDFGCGTGTSLAIMRREFPRARLIGYEPADGLRSLAAHAAAQVPADVLPGAQLALADDVDAAYCNGVFHHIAPDARAPAMHALAHALVRGGLAFLWENSPFNPGTRIIMSRIPFDRDARLLTPGALRRLAGRAGLEVVRTEYHFVFPRALRAFRFTEPWVRALPLGGQYLVVARRV